MNLKNLTDDALLLHTDKKITDERANIVDLIASFAEIEVRKLYLQSGHESMFDWLTKFKKYPNGSAGRRLAAGRVMYLFPWVGQKLQQGELHLSGLHLLASHREEPGFEKLLLECCGKSERDIGELLARRSNKPAPRREVVRMFVSKTSPKAEPAVEKNEAGSVPNQPHAGLLEDNVLLSSAPDQQQLGSSNDQTSLSRAPNQLQAGSPMDQPASSSVPNQTEAQEGEILMRMTLTLDKETFDALKHAQKLTDSKDMATVVKLALQVFIDKNDRSKKLIDPAMPRKTVKEKTKQQSAPSRHIPIATQRLAFKRDGWQCTHVHNGVRCQERDHLELDHVVPFALGGTSDLENIRVVCRAHNRWYAVQSFGVEFIEKKINESRDKKFSSAPNLNREEQNISPPLDQC